MFITTSVSIETIAKFFDLITIIILLYATSKNFTKILSQTKILVFMIFFMFYIFPLCLDYVIGFPEYTSRTEDFTRAQEDTLSRIVYDMSLLICSWMILRVKEKKIRSGLAVNFSKRTLSNVYMLLTIGVILPTVFVFILQMPQFMLYTPMWRELDFINTPKNYSFVEQLDFVGICCCIICLFGKLRNTSIFMRIFALSFLYVNICIEGKRGIIFFSLLCIILLLIIHMQMDKKEGQELTKNFIKLAIYGGIAIAIMLVVSVNVKIGRGYEEDPSIMNTALRIDFTRDDRVRYAIYEVLHPERLKILDYPGQTILPFITWIFPLNLFFSKVFNYTPHNYSYYLSSALLGGGISANESFMTPSVFGEIISNFYLLGIFIMPIFSIWFIKKISNLPYPINLFVIITYAAWQMYPVGYIMLYLEFTFVLCLLYYIKKRKRIRS